MGTALLLKDMKRGPEEGRGGELSPGARATTAPGESVRDCFLLDLPGPLDVPSSSPTCQGTMGRVKKGRVEHKAQETPEWIDIPHSTYLL